MEMYPGEIELEFKHFPLSLHSDAALAHQAALAAGDQGKFWEMHGLLFKNQTALKRGNLITYAVQLGLDREKFIAAIDSMKFESIVRKDIAEGVRLGVIGTPTFFINGKKFLGPLSLEVLESIIDADLSEMGFKSASRILADSCSRGPGNAPITITLFTDFQSPISAQTAWALDKILPLYPEKIRLVFKHFPLRNHAGGILAHETALAAAHQGKFWEMHDLLFLDQQDFTLEKALQNGRKLQLDIAKVERALNDHRYRPIIARDLQEGKNRNVRGVPTIFINDRRVDGLETVSALMSIIETELGKLRAFSQVEPTRISQRH